MICLVGVENRPEPYTRESLAGSLSGHDPWLSEKEGIPMEQASTETSHQADADKSTHPGIADPSH